MTMELLMFSLDCTIDLGGGVFLCYIGSDINLNGWGFLANNISLHDRTLPKDCRSCFKSMKELWILLKLIPTTSFLA